MTTQSKTGLFMISTPTATSVNDKVPTVSPSLQYVEISRARLERLEFLEKNASTIVNMAVYFDNFKK